MSGGARNINSCQNLPPGSLQEKEREREREREREKERERDTERKRDYKITTEVFRFPRSKDNNITVINAIIFLFQTIRAS